MLEVFALSVCKCIIMLLLLGSVFTFFCFNQQEETVTPVTTLSSCFQPFLQRTCRPRLHSRPHRCALRPRACLQPQQRQHIPHLTLSQVKGCFSAENRNRNLQSSSPCSQSQGVCSLDVAPLVLPCSHTCSSSAGKRGSILLKSLSNVLWLSLVSSMKLVCVVWILAFVLIVFFVCHLKSTKLLPETVQLVCYCRQ